MLIVFPLGMAGCGGINTGTTVSPASLLLPGLIRNDSSATNAPAALKENSPTFALNK
jgi:hypothetical protein